MRALVTGANGFLGAALTARLVALGHSARVLVRATSDVESLEGLVVERAIGDVEDLTSIKRACDSMDVVFHLAGIRRAADPTAFMRVNAGGTRAVCEAMVAAGARRLVLCGSLAASGPAGADRPKREEDPFAPAEAYGESKAEAERIAWGFAPRLQVSVVRPSRIVGPGDKENLVFFKLVQKGWRLVIGGPPRPISFVDVDDVVDLLLLAAERPEAVGQAFFSTAQALTLPALLDIVAQALRVKTRTLYVPAPALWALGSLADVVSRATGASLPLNRKLARQLLAPGWSCSGDKAQRLLGHVPQRSVADSVRRTASSYRERGWL